MGLLAGRWCVLGRRLGRELGRVLLDWLCPAACPACGAAVANEGLCCACEARLERRRPPWCPRCGEPVLAPGARCQRDHDGIAGITAARAPFRYRGSGGALVRRLKFRHDRAALAYLARAMAAQVGPCLEGPRRRWCVVAVPLHPRKRRRRGIDQAAWLAGAVALRLGLDVAPGCLARVRDTLPQGDPRVTSRERNVEGAFALRRAERLRGRRVLLVDDVTTSGTTARECARLLRQAGCAGVVLSTAARS